MNAYIDILEPGCRLAMFAQVGFGVSGIQTHASRRRRECAWTSLMCCHTADLLGLDAQRHDLFQLIDGAISKLTPLSFSQASTSIGGLALTA